MTNVSRRLILILLFGFNFTLLVPHGAQAEVRSCYREMTLRAYFWGAVGYAQLGLGVGALNYKPSKNGMRPAERVARAFARNFFDEIVTLFPRRDLTLVESIDLIEGKLKFLNEPALFALGGMALLVTGADVFRYLQFQGILKAAVKEVEQGEGGPAVEKLRLELVRAASGEHARFRTKRRFKRQLSEGERQRLIGDLSGREGPTHLQVALKKLANEDAFCKSSQSVSNSALTVARALLELFGVEEDQRDSEFKKHGV